MDEGTTVFPREARSTESASLGRFFDEQSDLSEVIRWMEEVEPDPPDHPTPATLRFSDFLAMIGERQDLARKLSLVFKSFRDKNPDTWIVVWRSTLSKWAAQALEADGISTSSPEARRALLIWAYSAIDALHRHRALRFERPSYGIRRWTNLLAQALLGLTKEEASAESSPIAWICKSLVDYEESGHTAFTLDEKHVDAETAKLIPKVDGFIRPFRRIDTFDSLQQNGAMGWDVRCEQHGDEVLIGATWHWGNSDLWRIPAQRLEKGEGVLNLLERSSTPASVPNGGQHAAWGYSRRILLGRFDDSGALRYLLVAPTGDPDQGRPCFEVYRADGSPGPERMELLARLEVPEERHVERESVYSMLELEPGLVLIGLRGTNAAVRLGLLRVRRLGDAAELEYRWLEDIPPVLPSGNVVSRNPVWTLAKLPERAGGKHVVFAGCEDGRILQLLVSGHETSGSEVKRAQVDRLGSPVWNLVVRPASGAGKDLAHARIYAGTANGTVVAYERLRDDIDPRHRRSKEISFAQLWATSDNGPVAGMHLLPDEHGAPALLLVLSQAGAGLVIHDPVHLPGDEPLPTRQPVPGRRVGRFELETTTCFASAIVPCRTKGGNPLFLVCSGEHRMSLFELLPTAEEEGRKDEIEASIAVWRGTVENKDPSLLSRECQRIRVMSAISGAAPAFSRYAVMWILRKGVGLARFPMEKPSPRPELQRCWLPRHLRPLFDLSTAWEEVVERDDRLDPAIDALERVLRRNHARNDRELFDQVVATVLTRLNRFIATIAFYRPNVSAEGERGPLEPEDAAREDRACRFAVQVLATIENFSGLWGGTPDETWSLVSMVRSLLDGDTLWALSTRMTEKTPAEEAQRWRKIFERRGHLINSLLSRGNRRVASEVLRAGNMALLRAGLRHSVELRSRAAPHGIPWAELEKYFHAIGELAAQSLRAGTGTRTLLAHEVTRAFAMALQLCPHDAIAIAHRYVEAVPPEIDAVRVLEQVEIAKQLGLAYDDQAMRHFEYALTLEGFPLKGLESRPRRRGNDRNLRHQLEVVRHLVKWVEDLAASFRSAAFRIPLFMAEVHQRRLRRLFPDEKKTEPSRQGDVRHSGLFWGAFLGDLVRLIRDHDIASRRAQISPRLVLASEKLRALCERHLQGLKERFDRHEVFEPHMSHYARALSSLRDASADFRRSAELQRNLVLGMLNHGLLEALDEHVLELEEIALALNPVLVGLPGRTAAGKLQRSIRPLLPYHKTISVQERFATYIINRARKAETIPKNLRALQSMLNHEEMLQLLKTHSSSRGSATSLSLLLEEYKAKFKADHGDVALDQREERHLRIALEELFQNHEVHGQEIANDDRVTALLRSTPREIMSRIEFLDDHMHDHLVKATLPMRKRLWGVNDEDRLDGVELMFPLSLEIKKKDPQGKRFKTRIQALIEMDLQELFPPREDPYVSSHGMGLYLANLAAAVVGWRLLPLSAVLSSTGRGSLTFLLYRYA